MHPFNTLLDKNCWILAAVYKGVLVGVQDTREGGGVAEGEGLGGDWEEEPAPGFMGTQQKPVDVFRWKIRSLKYLYTDFDINHLINRDLQSNTDYLENKKSQNIHLYL